jgi:hypothetical protein
MPTLTQLNNQCGTSPTTSLPLLDHLGPNHNYYKATNGLWGVTERELEEREKEGEERWWWQRW